MRRVGLVAVSLLAASACASPPAALSVRTTSGTPVVRTPGDPAPPPPVLRAVADSRRDGRITGRVQWITSTVQRAAAINQAGPGSADLPLYIVELRGRFVINDAPRPAEIVNGAVVVPKSPSGTVLILFIPREHPEKGGGGLWLAHVPVELSPYGVVHTFDPARHRTGTTSGLPSDH